MVYPKARPIMIALILVTTSLAGCLGDEATLEEVRSTESLGTVYTSTWHVQDLVQNIAGDKVDVQLLAPSNIPVHDYEPTSTDLLYLRDADLFFYHGLGLETWVNTTIESMGADAPEFVSIHTLPDGSIVLEYEAMLVGDLCEHLTDGPFESSNLSHEGHLNEIHAEHVAHRLSFPMHDDDHDDDNDDPPPEPSVQQIEVLEQKVYGDILEKQHKKFGELIGGLNGNPSHNQPGILLAA